VGFFDDLNSELNKGADQLRKAFGGGVDSALLRAGRPGRGLIKNIQVDGAVVAGAVPEQPCMFTLEIDLYDTDPYPAFIRQRVPQLVLAQLVPDGSVVMVRVDPMNLTRVAIDWNSPAPVAPSQEPPPTAAELLESGDECEAVFLQGAPLRVRNAAGEDLHALTVTVIGSGRNPYQTQIRRPIPAEGMPLLFPGSRLPARIWSADPSLVAIDWAAAVENYRTGGS
jgi:hypothetical protein